MTDSFFTIDRRADGTEWIRPTDHARGPWNDDACHGGPPTAMLVRALERTIAGQRLARISVELSSPVPMAGFRIETDVAKRGRTTSQSSAAIIDADGVVRSTAIGLHIRTAEVPVVPTSLDNAGLDLPLSATASPGDFPRANVRPDWVGFRQAVEVRYPPGSSGDGGRTTVFMRTVSPLPDEVPTPFQRIAPLADCGNAFSRHSDGDALQFINADLTIALHRDPVGEWLGSRSSSQWQPGGVGLADALLFDDQGPVGRALQTLLLRPVPAR
ncbi:MAG: thioesterase family protein [Desertimonas sp.]